jgi:hypothetical protein
MSPRSTAILLAMGIALAPVASAQHPRPKGPRPLHVRIAAADVVAIATIGPSSEGRIEIRDAMVLRGDAPADFEIKRSPGNPPPFVTGVPAVLLLRGARPPYVLVDEPREVTLLRDENDAQRWSEALKTLVDAGADPDGLLETYLAWLDGDDETLREAAAPALFDSHAPFLPLGAGDAVARAQIAVDPKRSPATRRSSAMLALTNAEGAAALMDAVPGAAADPQVVAMVLRAVIPVSREARVAAVQRALDSDASEVRRAGLFAAPSLWTDAVAKKVSGLAAHDPDPDVRTEAAEAVKSAGGR